LTCTRRPFTLVLFEFAENGRARNHLSTSQNITDKRSAVRRAEPEVPVNRRTRVIWIPSCFALLLSGAWFVLTFRTPWMFAFLSRTFHIAFDVQHAWTYLLIAMVPLALAGMLAAFLSWRAGGRRWERLVAAETPLGMFCVSQFYSLWRSGSLRETRGSLLLYGVSLFAGYLFAGALPFLLLRERVADAGSSRKKS
jgi:hypothetical protein